MKIDVTPEGREGIYIPTKESLIAWIKSKKFKYIHNFIPSGSMVIGADHDVKSVIEDIQDADRLGIITGKQRGINFGHALSVIRNERLEMYDIGEVTETDLNIIFPTSGE